MQDHYKKKDNFLEISPERRTLEKLADNLFNSDNFLSVAKPKPNVITSFPTVTNVGQPKLR